MRSRSRQASRSERPALDVAFFAPMIGPVAMPALYPKGTSTGGSETQIWAIARGLAARGRRVGVAIRGAPREAPATVAGVEIVNISAGGSGRIAAYGSHFRTVARLSAGMRAKLIVQRAAGTETALAAAAAALARRPFVYSSAHVVDFDLGSLEPSARRVRLFEWGVRNAQEIVVQTDEQSEMCRRRFGRPGIVIRSVAERAQLRRGAPEAFLWVGRFDRWKNPGAYLDLARSMPDARFRMIGTRSDEVAFADAMKREAAAIPNLELLPARPRREAMELFDSAVAVVSTSDFEGMPNVLLEGWARGVPALALRHDPDGVIERHGLGGFAGGDAGRLAALAEGIWRGREDQTALSARCREYVQGEHSLERVLDGWERLLGRCLGE